MRLDARLIAEVAGLKHYDSRGYAAIESLLVVPREEEKVCPLDHMNSKGE
jgi:hypothetical protein